MARRQRKSTPVQDEQKKRWLDPADFRRVLDETHRQAKLAAEYAGNCGNVTKNFCDKENLRRQEFGVVRRFDRMTPQKRDAALADLLRMCVAAGFFDQASLDENGARNVLIESADVIREREPSPAPSAEEDRAALDSVVH